MEHGCECKSWLSYDLPVVSNESKASNVPSVSVNPKSEENHVSPFQPHRLAKENTIATKGYKRECRREINPLKVEHAHILIA